VVLVFAKYLVLYILIARYRTILRESSVGKQDLTFVNFLSCLLNPSSAFVV